MFVLTYSTDLSIQAGQDDQKSCNSPNILFIFPIYLKINMLIFSSTRSWIQYRMLIYFTFFGNSISLFGLGKFQLWHQECSFLMLQVGVGLSGSEGNTLTTCLKHSYLRTFYFNVSELRYIEIGIIDRITFLNYALAQSRIRDVA